MGPWAHKLRLIMMDCPWLRSTGSQSIISESSLRLWDIRHWMMWQDEPVMDTGGRSKCIMEVHRRSFVHCTLLQFILCQYYDYWVVCLMACVSMFVKILLKVKALMVFWGGSCSRGDTITVVLNKAYLLFRISALCFAHDSACLVKLMRFSSKKKVEMYYFYCYQ